MDRKSIKNLCRKNLKKHYLIFVAACLIAALLSVEYSVSLEGVRTVFNYTESMVSNGELNTTSYDEMSVHTVIGKLFNGDFKSAGEVSDELDGQTGTDSGFFSILRFDRSKGVFAFIVNTMSASAIFTSFVSAINSIINAEDITNGALTIISLAAFVCVWIFLLNTYRAVCKRLFLEGRIYAKVPIQRFMFLIKCGKIFKAAITMLLCEIYKILWSMTIVGGFIKYFSYFLVPYIIAEDPDISPKTAITLSRKMMYGHKKECFVLHLSFIWWDILSTLTLGLLGIFFVNPYKETVYSEFYVYVREKSVKAKIENSELLNDVYLYKKASRKKIENAYSDVLALMNEPCREYKYHRGIYGFFANVLGVVPFYGKDEQEYSDYTERKVKIKMYGRTLSGSIYPERLSPQKVKEIKALERLHYMRHYSICSLIMMFFIICFGGWLWEVVLHYVTDGELVNRGVIHGPWLPIYGVGSIMILLVLNKFRRKPLIEFLTAFLLCGAVEYITSFILENMYDGLKWWDYGGYFLNINGRVCAEGLVLFGLGGMAVVYFGAPVLDNIIRKIPKKILLVCCIVLVSAFVFDCVYSGLNPNLGQGVSDYADRAQEVCESSAELESFDAGAEEYPTVRFARYSREDDFLFGVIENDG